jgi:hypothetical protein
MSIFHVEHQGLIPLFDPMFCSLFMTHFPILLGFFFQISLVQKLIKLLKKPTFLFSFPTPQLFYDQKVP